MTYMITEKVSEKTEEAPTSMQFAILKADWFEMRLYDCLRSNVFISSDSNQCFTTNILSVNFRY